MTAPPADAEQRCLIFAPRGRDAQVIAGVLGTQDLPPHVCSSGADLMYALDGGAGCVVLSEEALYDLEAAELERWISQQPAWSDMPFIVFASKMEGRRATVLQALQKYANLLLLERPVNVQTLGAAAASALRGRHRQYEARRQLRDIEETERHLRLALRAGRLGSWELDLGTQTFSTSDLCRVNFGFPPEAELSYAALLEAIHPDDRQMQGEAVQKALAQQADFNIEYRIYWPDGSLHWVQVRGQPIPGHGAPRLAGVCADITERRTAEDRLRASREEVERANSTLELRIEERTSELARANDRLMREIGERERTQSALVQAQKMEAIGQLTGGIAHDFNNLLHVISMNLALIERFSSDERIKRVIEPARRAADRGAKLTSQLLAFARSQTLDLQPVDINAAMRNMSDLLRVSIGQQIPYALDVGEHELYALADPNQLEMAVLNLAINARDAMPGGGTINISTAVSRESIDGAEEAAFVVITVADTGTGIAPDIMAKVFDPFFTTKPSGKGTGLGLSQVYGFARQCGGSAKIRSRIGQGTAVELWLPLADKSEVEEPAGSAGEDAGGAGARVLVIEDNDDVRQVIVSGLQVLGYMVDEAPNGRAGLAALNAQLPDLMIVDYAMPDMNGAEVAARARARWPELPVLFATGYADMRAVEQLVGAEHILRKPFDINDLAAAARKALARRKNIAS